MLEFTPIDPVAISIGPIQIHWYGIMYLLGFGAFLALGIRRARQKYSCINHSQVSDLLFYGIVGTILGGRLGYMLFYNFGALLENPLSLFYVWQGGMSFHGGLIGVIVALWMFAKKQKLKLLQITDFSAPLVPIGLGAGRIGNFINGELWGRTSDVPWAMVFPYAGDQPRHPSQLYEFFLEGLVLFIIMWLYSNKPRPLGHISGMFILLYGVMRFTVEFVREPDGHIGFILGNWLSMGQLLSLPLIIGGFVLLLQKIKISETKLK